jgi:uncharacterized protein YbjT (DUF2867 family)
VRLLHAAAVPVRALLRNPQKRFDLEGPGVDIVWGDFDKPETLEAALEGIEKVFLLSSPDPRQVELQGNLIEIAQRRSVRHIVKLSALGAAVDSPVAFGRWHAATERQIEESGIPWTHLRPHYSMQNLFVYAQSIALKGVFHAPAGEGRIAMVDARDVAAVAAAVLTSPGHEGRAYELTGPEALSLHDVAATLTEVIGKKVTYEPVSAEQALTEALDAGAPEWFAEAMVSLYGVYAAGHGAHVTELVSVLSGRAPRSFAQFAREYDHKFRERG